MLWIAYKLPVKFLMSRVGGKSFQHKSRSSLMHPQTSMYKSGPFFNIGFIVRSADAVEIAVFTCRVFSSYLLTG